MALSEESVRDEMFQGLSAMLYELDTFANYVSVLEVLERLGEKAATPEFVNALVELLRYSDIEVKRAAIYSLGKLGKSAATIEMILNLLDVLLEPNKLIRHAALDCAINC